MTFQWPWMHWFLILLPLLAFGYIRMQQRRRRFIEHFGRAGLSSAVDHAPGWRRHLPAVFFLLGLGVIIASLARPQMEVSLPRVEGIVMLVFDVSGSMAAQDMQPNRMEAAKVAARAFVESQPETIQVGVAAFSDNGFSVQPPTNDQAAIFSAIDRLAPQRGTSLGRGIEASLNTIILGSMPVMPDPGEGVDHLETALSLNRKYPYAALVLLTDGENNSQPDPLEAAQAASNLDVRIFTVGIGSPAGAVIEVDGFSIHTRLDEALLSQIALITGGTYYNATNEEELVQIYSNLRPQFILKPEYMEMTAVFAAAGIVLLLVGGIISLVWFGRLP